MSGKVGADVMSYGGGVQSNALLVMAADGRFDCQDFVFANVGDDSETPKTLAYVREHAVPFAEAHGLRLHVVDKARRGGGVDTLLQRINRQQRSIPFPMRMANGAPGKRQCTGVFKIQVVAKWTKAQGFTEASPARVAVGISRDEWTRANSRRKVKHEVPVYPLLTHEPPLSRQDCARIITAAGLPMPPKSACWFCPMKRPADWLEQRRNEPELFAKACALEARMIERRTAIGKDPVYMTRLRMPLAEAIPDTEDALSLFDALPADAACDSSSCFT